MTSRKGSLCSGSSEDEASAPPLDQAGIQNNVAILGLATVDALHETKIPVWDWLAWKERCHVILTIANLGNRAVSQQHE